MDQPDVVYLAGLDFFDHTVSRFPTDAWQDASPCAGWRAVDVLGHIGTAVKFGTELLSDVTPDWQPADPPGTAVDGDPGQWWRAMVAPARQAVQGADMSRVVDSPMGRRSIGEGLTFPAIDLFVHAWDVGRAAGLEVEIPQSAIDFCHSAVAGIGPEQLRGPGAFAAEITPGADATPSEAFLAWTGRDPHWTP